MRPMIIIILNLFLVSQSWALSQLTADHYYGIPAKQLESDPDLKLQLHSILAACHKENADFDQLIEPTTERTDCYKHESLGYKGARRVLFGLLHLEQNKEGTFWVKTTYCDDVVTNDDISAKKKLGNLQIPSADFINTEHSWPQSRFTSNFSRSLQKSDLHALFPVRSKVNSVRGNRPFGHVIKETTPTCREAKYGYNKDNVAVFEPTDVSKGNIARAIFYFSTRYKIIIDPLQESVLRQWHILDPVDADEIARHEEIFRQQKVRNPYIDHPEWVEAIDNF